MNKKTSILIKKLGKKYPMYEISTKNFLPPEVNEVEVNGKQVVEKIHEAVVQIIVFQSEHAEVDVPFAGGIKTIKESKSNILRKVDGMGRGSSKTAAVASATVDAINALGIF